MLSSALKMDVRNRRCLRALASVFVVVLSASNVVAWPAPLVESLARDARKLLPKTLARLIREREREILEEAARSPWNSLAAGDVSAGRLQPETVALVDSRITEVVQLMRERRTSEGIIRLGGMLRLAVDLTDPVLSVDAEGFPPGLTSEYYLFVQASLDKIPIVLDGEKSLKLTRKELPLYWQRVLDRSRLDSPVLRTEMFQGGRVVSHRAIDFRSPVFGVASLAYSRAVTAIAATWLVTWREVRGDLTRSPRPRQLEPHESAVPGLPPSVPSETTRP